jgi:C-terminal processing protease CtpA/Prc
MSTYTLLFQKTVKQLRKEFPISVPWSKILKKPLKIASEAKSMVQLNKSFKLLMKSLHKYDGHCYFVPAKRKKKTLRKTNKPTVKQYGEIGYIKVLGFDGNNSEEMKRYAKFIQKGIFRIGAKNWILDLRHNGGGNLYAMLLGISPFLIDNKVMGTLVLKNESTSHFLINYGIKYAKGKVYFGKKIMGMAEHCKKIKYSKIAILVGPKTKSSGELLAMCLQSNKNVKIFGKNTARACSNMSIHHLPDGSFITYPTMVGVDQSGKRFTKGIKPNVITNKPVTVAKSWLMSK